MSRMPDMRPTAVRFATGHVVTMPPGTTPDDARKFAVRFSKMTMSPEETLGQAETIGPQKPMTAGEHVGRTVASLLGIDYDQMKDLQDHGVALSMIPMAPQGISKKMVDEGIGKVIGAGEVKPRRGMFHSLLVDKGGNIVDLGDLTHDVAIARTQGANVEKFTDAAADAALKSGNLDDLNDVVDLPAELERHGLVRLQVQPSSIAAEIHHPPTPHQVDALSRLMEANPRAKASYDMFHGERNEFKNGVSGDDFLKKLNEFYYSGKTNSQALRDSLDNKLNGKLEGSLQFSEPGEWVP